jgi:hypothetical protein
MAVETADDLAGMFHPDDFGVPMVAYVLDGSVPFAGIQTTGHVSEFSAMSSASTVDASMMVPRIIAMRAPLAALRQNDEIEMPDGRRVLVVDIHFKGDLIVIHYHEHW